MTIFINNEPKEKDMAVDFSELRKELEALADVSEAYRVKKAEKYISLANPESGKKPSEAAIAAELDKDEELSKMRKERSVHEINSKLLELEIKYGRKE